MNSTKRSCVVGIIACASALCACATDSSRVWVKQGPGNYDEESAAGSAKRPESPAKVPTEEPVTKTELEPQPADVVTREGPAAPTALPPSAPIERGGYTQAARYGDLLFLSGQIPSGADDSGGLPIGIGEQTDAVMRKIEGILGDHGLTMANIIHVTVYLSSMNDLPALNAAYEAHFRGTLPARTVVDVDALPRGALVQISVIAGR